MNSYLINRKQYVDIDDSKSSLLPITTGVPQGSILGPLLFIIYINDISSSSNTFKFITYADDTTLFVTLDSVHQQNCDDVSQENKLNSEITKITEWLNLNKLSLNADKTKCMVYRTYNKTVRPPKLLINNQMIEYVENFNFLGIIMDSQLNWKVHMETIGKKISKTVGILNKLKLKDFLPMYTLKTIYDSLINSYLNYGILCWGFKLNRLVKLQKKAVRIIANTKYNKHTDPIFKKLNILKVTDIVTRKLYKFFYRYSNNTLPYYFLNNTYLNHPTHSHHTRNSTYVIPRVIHKYAEYNVRYQLPILLNNNENSIINKVNTHSEFGFSFYVKRHLINSYEDNCTIPNCYVCNT